MISIVKCKQVVLDDEKYHFFIWQHAARNCLKFLDVDAKTWIYADNIFVGIIKADDEFRSSWLEVLNPCPMQGLERSSSMFCKHYRDGMFVFETVGFIQVVDPWEVQQELEEKWL